MKKQTIWLLVIIMTLTFSGLIYVQFLYMTRMVSMRNDQFDEGARHSLYAVSTMLEQEEARHFLKESIMNVQTSEPQATEQSTEVMSMSFTTQSGLRGDLTLEGEPGQLSTVATHSDNPLLRRPLQAQLNGQYMYQKRLVDEVVLNIMTHSVNRPITDRADSASVSKFLRYELDNNGLRIPFEFAITNRSNAVIYRSSGFPRESWRALSSNPAVYTQTIFPNDPANKLYFLNVYFPTKQSYIFSSIRFMLPAMAFTLILMLIFIYCVVVAFRQKRVNEMKNDFINNMTHELKTPISSISLAGQMLSDPSVRKSETMMRHITEVITDETKRLQFLVEKVLQTSLYYNQKAALHIVDVDANKAISNIVHNFKLKVEKFGGSISSELTAPHTIVNVDEMHFTNVIFNLLDNAVKYRSEERPLLLKVSTADIGNHQLRIVVSDNGRGIRKDDLRKIFDKFYRVSTGARHDVKGFGLGLAYVRKMVSEFQGSITVESEFGVGTKFLITLPLAEGSGE